MIKDKYLIPGQVWTYEAPEGFEDSRIIIGSMDDIPEHGEIVCISVTNAPIPQGASGAVDGSTLPFIPFSREAVVKTVLKMEGNSELHKDFADYYSSWRSETGGKDYFTTTLPIFFEMLVTGSNPNLAG